MRRPPNEPEHEVEGANKHEPEGHESEVDHEPEGHDPEVDHEPEGHESEVELCGLPATGSQGYTAPTETQGAGL